MKLTGVTLDLDSEDGTTLEELVKQLQGYTDKVLMVVNQELVEVKRLEKLKPLSRFEIEEADDEDSTYTVRKLSKSGGDDDEDSDSGDTYTLFRKDAFKIMTTKKSSSRHSHHRHSKGERDERTGKGEGTGKEEAPGPAPIDETPSSLTKEEVPSILKLRKGKDKRTDKDTGKKLKKGKDKKKEKKD